MTNFVTNIIYQTNWLTITNTITNEITPVEIVQTGWDWGLIVQIVVAITTIGTVLIMMKTQREVRQARKEEKEEDKELLFHTNIKAYIENINENRIILKNKGKEFTTQNKYIEYFIEYTSILFDIEKSFRRIEEAYSFLKNNHIPIIKIDSIKQTSEAITTLNHQIHRISFYFINKNDYIQKQNMDLFNSYFSKIDSYIEESLALYTDIRSSTENPQKFTHVYYYLWNELTKYFDELLEEVKKMF